MWNLFWHKLKRLPAKAMGDRDWTSSLWQAPGVLLLDFAPTDKATCTIPKEHLKQFFHII